MTPERWAEIERVCHAALVRDPATRAAFLDDECAGDHDLRREVESLLAYDAAAGAFLERSALREAATQIAGDREPIAVPQIPGYTILQLLGEGGMGVVYLAEQVAPLLRRVALKLIKPGMDSRQVVARFETERQALARMDHPNIAAVFDAGTSVDGRPYFVMELVAGVPITEYCDRHRLSTRARLELFVQVCSAVQHAHQKGVIHRDLKPSNVLVSGHDGRHVPKVIDFGTAKATARPLIDRPRGTEVGTIIGTLEYMSPEQAALSSDVDTTTDVYSLGVVLYELLVGSLPFDGVALRSAGYDEMRRVIRESEPPKPSDRLTGRGDAARLVAEARRTDLGPLTRQLAGDLDWVVLRALEKDRARRYATVAAFAVDVERFLANKPVEARPPSAIYRLGKFARRYRGAVAAAAALLIVLLAGLATSTALYFRAERARVEADRERAQADVQRAAAEEQRRIADTLRIAAETANAYATAGWNAAEGERAKATAAIADGERQRAMADTATAETTTHRNAADRAGAEAASQLLRAVVAHAEAERLRGAEEAAREATLEAEHRTYLATIGAADGELRARAPGAARQRLLSIPEARRDWEWRHLWLRTDPSLLTLSPAAPCGPSHVRPNEIVPGDHVLVVADQGRRIYHQRCGTLAAWDSSTFQSAGDRVFPESTVLAMNRAGRVVLGPRHPDGPPLLRVVEPNPSGAVVTLGPFESRPRCADVNADGTLVVVGLSPAPTANLAPSGGVYEVWNTMTRRRVSRVELTAQAHPERRSPVATPCIVRFSPDSRMIASSSATVDVWAVAGTDLSDRIHAGAVSQPIAFSPDGTRLAVGRANGSIDLLDLRDGGGPSRSLNGTTSDREVLSLAFSPKGTRIIAGTNTDVGIWDVADGKLLTVLAGHEAPVIAVAVPADGRFMVSSDAAGTLRVWPPNATSGVTRVDLGLPQSQALGLFADRVAAPMTATGEEPGCESDASLAQGAAARVAATSPDGEWLAFRQGRCIIVRDRRTVKRGGVFRPSGVPTAILFRSDAVLIVAWTIDPPLGPTSQAGVVAWDWRSNRVLATAAAPTHVGTRLAMSADGRRLAMVAQATDQRSSTVSIWEGDLSREIGRLPVPEIVQVAFSPDGRRLVSVSRGNSLGVWDTDRLQLVLTLNDTEGHPGGVIFTADGRIIGGRTSGGLTIWESQKPPCAFCPPAGRGK